jgi:hypothetical protein
MKQKSPVCAGLFCLFLRKLHLDFDVYTTWQVETHQGVNRLVGWFVYVDESIVSSQLEVLHRLLVDVWPSNNAEASQPSWQRHRSFNSCAGALCGVNNFLCGLIDHPVIVCSQADSYSDFCHDFSFAFSGDTVKTC